jgi:hypothetical protein
LAKTHLDEEHPLHASHREDAADATPIALELLFHEAKQCSVCGDGVDRILKKAFSPLREVRASQEM